MRTNWILYVVIVAENLLHRNSNQTMECYTADFFLLFQHTKTSFFFT